MLFWNPELVMGIEPTVSPIPRECPTAEPHQHTFRGPGGNRTPIIGLQSRDSPVELQAQRGPRAACQGPDDHYLRIRRQHGRHK